MNHLDIRTQVKQQYEQLPYPYRNPEDEKKRLIPTVGDNLYQLNHYGFKGKQNFDKDFQCLIAGGGTGDSAIYLAEQLKNKNACITYLDMSEASIQIAQKRAEQRGLSNISWKLGAVEDIPEMNLGEFDYINCSGVLHHLPDPEQGLQNLRKVLRPQGVIYLMLYAKYGRRSIYEMQELLKLACDQNDELNEKIKTTRKLIKELPETNAFIKDLSQWKSEIDEKINGDAGLVDLLLHPQDRAYNVPKLYQLAQSADLKIVDFVGQFKRSYSLKHLIQDSKLGKQFYSYPKQRQQAMAELIHGGIIKHQFYLAASDDTQATIDDLSNAIVLTMELAGRHKEIAKTMNPGQPLTLNFTRLGKEESFTIHATNTLQMLFFFFDGVTPLKEAIKKIMATDKKIKKEHLINEIRQVFNLLYPVGWAHLTQTRF